MTLNGWLQIGFFLLAILAVAVWFIVLPQLLPAVRRAVKNTPIDTLLADAGYDAEANHATCRERLGIRSTVIALNWRGSRKWPRAKYRRQMVRRFRARTRARWK